MNWTHVIIAGYVGATIAVVVGVFRKKGWVGKAGAVAIALVAIMTWNIFDVKYLIPREKAGSSQSELAGLDAAMNQMPVYQVLKEQEPALWMSIRQQAIEMHKQGKTEQQVIDTIQPQILAVEMKRLQNAADENVVAFMQINMQQTAMVQKSSNEACFRFLFPDVKGGINSMRLLPREVTMRRMEVDAAMMRSAYGPEKHTVTDAERQQARQDIQPIVQQLMKRYGGDLHLMSDPHKAVGQEGIVCDQVQELWRNVLQLPPARAAGIIRLSVAGE